MTELNLGVANAIIEAAFVAAREDGVPPLTVVVLDEAGNLVSAQRQDGASMFRFDVALGKAWGAVALGVSSRAVGERAKSNPNFFAGLTVAANGRLLPQPGAVLICSEDGRVIGAVGASGGTGDQDEAACAAGVRSVGLEVPQ